MATAVDTALTRGEKPKDCRLAVIIEELMNACEGLPLRILKVTDREIRQALHTWELI